jgi:hypothetical protein
MGVNIMIPEPFYPFMSLDDFDTGLGRLVTREFPMLEVVRRRYNQTSLRYEIRHADVTIIEIDTHSMASGQMEIFVNFLHSTGANLLLALYRWVENAYRIDLKRWIQRIASDALRLQIVEQLIEGSASNHERQMQYMTRFAELRRSLPPLTDFETTSPTSVIPVAEDEIDRRNLCLVSCNIVESMRQDATASVYELCKLNRVQAA